MAGDWIKMRVDLVRDPAVKGISRELGISRFEVVGRLHSVWSWADQHLHSGDARGVTENDVDDEAGLEGFAKAMQKEGWLKILSTGISFPNFERHNGKPAKDRALTSKRTKRYRDANPVTRRDAASVTSASPEKIRSLSIGVTVSRETTGKPEPKPGESADDYRNRIEHGEKPHETPAAAAHSLTRAAEALKASREALETRAPMPEALKPRKPGNGAADQGELTVTPPPAAQNRSRFDEPDETQPTP